MSYSEEPVGFGSSEVSIGLMSWMNRMVEKKKIQPHLDDDLDLFLIHALAQMLL